LSVESEKEVIWDGEALIGWVTIDGIPTKVWATPEIIHREAAGFNDALTWEIEQHRAEIFEKLIPYLIKVNRKR